MHHVCKLRRGRISRAIYLFAHRQASIARSRCDVHDVHFLHRVTCLIADLIPSPSPSSYSLRYDFTSGIISN